MGSIGPGDEAAPIVADEMKAGVAGQRPRKAFDVLQQTIDRIIGDFGGRAPGE